MQSIILSAYNRHVLGNLADQLGHPELKDGAILSATYYLYGATGVLCTVPAEVERVLIACAEGAPVASIKED